MKRPQQLEGLSAELRGLIEDLNVASYVLDRDGTFSWLNRAATELVGDARGRKFTAVVAPEHSKRAQQEFARKLLGAAATDFPVTLLRPDGSRVVLQVSSVPLRSHGRVVGVFGVARPPGEAADAPAAGQGLTPRQQEVLTLLEQGASTDEIAAGLGIARETVRNHVRGVLRAMGARSRLEAIAASRRSRK